MFSSAEGHHTVLKSLIFVGLAGTTLVADSAEQPRIAELFDSVERAEPLTKSKVEHIFGIALTCDVGFCLGSGVARQGVHIGKIDFRHGKFGTLLILEELAGSCVSIAQIEVRYPNGQIVQGCSDAICWYYRAKRPWGLLSFGLGPPSAPPEVKNPEECVTSVIFNTSR